VTDTNHKFCQSCSAELHHSIRICPTCGSKKFADAPPQTPAIAPVEYSPSDGPPPRGLASRSEKPEIPVNRKTSLAAALAVGAITIGLVWGGTLGSDQRLLQGAIAAQELAVKGFLRREIDLTGPEIYQIALPSFVSLVFETPIGDVQGSGFIVGPDLVATNWHVVEDAIEGCAFFLASLECFEFSSVVAFDRNADLALVRVLLPDTPPLILAQSGRLEIGEPLFALSSPLGIEAIFVTGILSAVRPDAGTEILIHSIPISPGSSGGPIFNKQGRVVGIASGGFSEGQNLNVAVRSESLFRLLAKQL
jgi:S1-C subfamily serine protease